MFAPTSLLSVVLVGLQFACISYFALVYGLPRQVHWGIFCSVAGLLLGSWAILSMRFARLNVFPEPGKLLITRGPYRFIRHPMYTAVLLVCLGWLSQDFRLISLLIYGLLTSVLIVKVQYEEGLLRDRFPEYAAYSLKTYKLLPWIY
jgi:protein-S-isoprenylcysteine O-methyltransferase Ste14